MRFISTRIHGYLDYIVGVLLICAPWVLQFDEVESAKWVAVLLGAGTLLYSLITDYELGLLKIISMSGHLGIDMIGGAFLAVSPWLFGFSERVFWPHLIIGIMEVALALVTRKNPDKPETSLEHGIGARRSSQT